MGQVDGKALAAVAAGSVFTYAGIKGYSIPKAIQNIVQGQPPGQQTQAYPITGTAAPGGSDGGSAPGGVGSAGNPAGGSAAANQALGKRLAAAYGWDTGAQWNSLNNIVMSESGWNADAANPTSDARGIAQKITGWGPDYQEGNAAQQIHWLLTYIRGRYGDPVAAWQFHLIHGWY